MIVALFHSKRLTGNHKVKHLDRALSIVCMQRQRNHCRRLAVDIEDFTRKSHFEFFIRSSNPWWTIVSGYGQTGARQSPKERKRDADFGLQILCHGSFSRRSKLHFWSKIVWQDRKFFAKFLHCSTLCGIIWQANQLVPFGGIAMSTNLTNSGAHFKWIIVALLAGFVYMSIPARQPKNIEPSGEAWFQTEVVDAPKPVLVKFGADWCGPCRATDKSLDEYVASSKGEVKVVRVNVDHSPGISQHYGVSSIPHSFLFYKGKIVDDRVGSMDSKEIRSWISTNISKIH